MNCCKGLLCDSSGECPNSDISRLLLSGYDNSVATSPPEGVTRYCFHPVCLSVCVCVCLCVCPANILVFYFSAIGRDTGFIQDLYIGLYSIILTVIGQRLRSQGRYIAF